MCVYKQKGASAESEAPLLKEIFWYYYILFLKNVNSLMKETNKIN